MKLVVGLGNPGKEHSKNRHNTGFIILDKIAVEKGLEWRMEDKFECELVEFDGVILAKPQTFMNNSGNAVSKLINFYKVGVEDLIVIHDDVDLPLGAIKKQKGKNAAGHHGVEDIIEKLGSKDFWRIRVGIGKPQDKRIPVDKWVLQDFSDEELEKVRSLKVDILSL